MDTPTRMEVFTSSEFSAAMETIGRVGSISSVEFVDAMASLTDLADFIPEPISFYRSETLFLWRCKVTGDKRFPSSELRGYAKRLNSQFVRATSWKAVKNAFVVFREETYEHECNNYADECAEDESIIDSLDAILVYYEKVVQEIISQVSCSLDVIEAAKSVKNLIIRVKLLNFTGITLQAFNTMPFSCVNDLFENVKSIANKLLQDDLVLH